MSRSLLRQPMGSLGLAIALAFACLWLSVSPASADRLNPQPNYTLKELRLGDLTARGRYATLDIWFPGYGDYQVIDGNYVQIEFDHSDIIWADDSNIVLSINDLPVSSLFLTPQNAKRNVWKVNLPKDRLKKDLNHIELKYHMRLKSDECTDWDDSSLWSNVYPSSMIHYEYAQPLQFLGLPAPDLALFPEPFIRTTVSAPRIAIVVPAEPSSADYSAAATVAARFGQLAGGKQVSVTLHKANEVTPQLQAENDFVLVGKAGTNSLIESMAGALPLKSQKSGAASSYVDANGKAIEPESGVIQEIISPWDKRFGVLVISGGNDDGLKRAARTIGSSTALKAMQGPYTVVTKAAEELQREGNLETGAVPTTITLDSLGMVETTVKGPGAHTVAFSFDALPPESKEGAYFDLVMSHSPLTDPDRSNITVTLNGTPIWTLLAKEENAARTTYRIKLPAADLRPGVNSLKVTFTLYTKWAEGCGPLAPERVWGVLFKESGLVLPPGTGHPALDLSNLPYPFLQNGSAAGTYLALPPEKELQTDSLQVAVELGRQILGNNTEIQAGVANKLTDDEKKKYNFIAFGLPGSQGVLAEVGSKLPMALTEISQRALQRPELVLLGLKDIANLGVLELVSSPWNPDKALLVISGTSAEMAKKAQLSINDKLPTGNVAIMSVNAEIQALDPLDPTATKVAGLKIGAAAATDKPEQTMAVQRRGFNLAAIPALAIVFGMLAFMAVKIAR